MAKKKQPLTAAIAVAQKMELKKQKQAKKDEEKRKLQLRLQQKKQQEKIDAKNDDDSDADELIVNSATNSEEREEDNVEIGDEWNSEDDAYDFERASSDDEHGGEIEEKTEESEQVDANQQQKIVSAHDSDNDDGESDGGKDNNDANAQQGANAVDTSTNKKNKKNKKKKKKANNNNNNQAANPAQPTNTGLAVPVKGPSWDTLAVPLHPKVLEVIQQKFGFPTMTPVQAAAIPPLLQNKDVVAEACTGSGKTLSYLIPVYHMLLTMETPIKPNHLYALVITPTRELAAQVYQVAQLFAQHTGISTKLLTGGNTGAKKEDSEISDISDGKFHVIVGTPGRLADILDKYGGKPQFILKDFAILIMDEADRILDMGFEVQVGIILSKLPKQRRTGLFSATQTTSAHELIKSGLRNPVRVTVQVTKKATKEVQSIPKELKNFYVICPIQDKLSQLVHFFTAHTDKKTIVYFLTCACVDFFNQILPNLPAIKKSGVKIFALHGKMDQKKRNNVYNEYLRSNAGVLICTDVAARGLDIPGVHYIIQYDAPQDPNVFIHRIGRTARMGKSGIAIIYLTEQEDNYVEFLSVKKVPIAEMEAAQDVPNVHADVEQLVLSDRAKMEKAVKAFISFVRAYKEHHCQYIFQFNKVDWAALAKSFALLRLPRMVEMQKLRISYKESPINPDSIPYLDPHREKERQQAIAQKQAEREKRKRDKAEGNAPQKKPDKWHVRTEQKNIRDKIRAIKSDKRKKRAFTELELDELKYEAKMLKKLKAGRITEEEFEIAVGERADEDMLEFERMEKEFNEKNGNNNEDGDDDYNDNESKKKKKRKGKHQSK